MGGYHDEIHFNQGHHTGRAHPYRDPVAQVCGQTCEFCNGCDNLGGGMVDAISSRISTAKRRSQS
ncbi:MAG: hypothetical protein ACLR5S_09525 [Ruminococcus sp.]